MTETGSYEMRQRREGGEIQFDERGNRERVAQLRKAGVTVWSAERVFIADDVRLDHIEAGAILMNAVIAGEQTAIGAHARVGTSGTAVLTNTQVGRAVELGAGSYQQTTLFDDAKVRGFAELRQGTVLEETAEVGHNVGLKHSFFTTGVVAGSGINFCDVLVTGGSSRQDHSEIGSGTVHFNFDPRGDKYGSLLGDVTGLLLRQRRVFIGGNCGIVAPVIIGHGSVVAAGTTVRRDVEPGMLYSGEPADMAATKPKEFDPNVYGSLKRKFHNTAILAGNLQALEAWYTEVRLPGASGLERALCEGALRNIRLHLEHRALEWNKVLSKLAQATSSGKENPFEKQHRKLVRNRRQIMEVLTQTQRVSPPANFVKRYLKARKAIEHGTAIRETPEKPAVTAELWLADMALQPSVQLSVLLR